MKPLTIERVKGQRQEFTFLGWKHDGLAFYAADPDGKPAVIKPVSAYPDDSSSGDPYRFPRIVLLEIIPKQFEIGWSDYHRKVLKRWREAELAEVDAMAPASLFVFDAMRTPAEINQQRQERKMAVEFHFRMLMDIPLEELIFPIAPLTDYRLIDFSSGRWADEMGEDFRAMMSETTAFGKRWRSAYGVGQEYHADQSILWAMRNVRYVMRGDGKKDYPLTSVDVEFPTDLEAQAYAQMQKLLGASALPSGDLTVETQAHVLKKLDQVLVGVGMLTELAGEQAVTRDKWAENPLGSREGSADYLLAMRAVGIKGERAAALVYFGYGETREKCAKIAGVSKESIKRDLARARLTPYAKFFARTRRQKLEARKAMKKPDDAFARMKQLAEEDPEKLRAVIDQMIAKAQKVSGDESAWENTVAGLS